MAEPPRAWQSDGEPAGEPPGGFLPPTDRPPPPRSPPPPPAAPAPPAAPQSGGFAPPVGYAPPSLSAPVGRTSGQAVASLVLGICGLIILPLVCSVLAIVFGNLARKEIERDPTMQGRGIATAGLTIGVAGLGLWLLIIVAAVAA